jgi:hypothetical protein
MSIPRVPERNDRLTMPSPELDGRPAEMVHLQMTRNEVRQLQSVLPWVLQALEERPNLTAKQRQRRSVTRGALVALMTRMGESAPAAEVGRAPEADI